MALSPFFQGLVDSGRISLRSSTPEPGFARSPVPNFDFEAAILGDPQFIGASTAGGGFSPTGGVLSRSPVEATLSSLFGDEESNIGFPDFGFELSDLPGISTESTPLGGFNIGGIGFTPSFALGTVGGLFGGIPGTVGGGFLGTLAAESAAEEEASQLAVGSGTGVRADDEISVLSSFVNSLTFGAFGESVDDQLHSFLGEITGFPDDEPDPDEEMGLFGEEGVFGGFSADDPGSVGAGDDPSAGTGIGEGTAEDVGAMGGGDDGDDGDSKIACTMMNHLYGYNPRRMALWRAFMLKHKQAPEWELGYHKLYSRAVAKMPTSRLTRWWLEPVIELRTDLVQRRLRGEPLTVLQWLYKLTVVPLVFILGWLVRKGHLKPANLSHLHQIWRQ